ncbi:MAG: hypothetical protein A4E36_01829 [Methanoregulaceae archaeon PtaB.Bin009]|nr:MAG: hypothetical protein A4E36_01829 [Methanoregulaceae archaeon PtaB.Bin009]
MPPPPPAYGDKVLRLGSLYNAERTAVDAHPALHTLLVIKGETAVDHHDCILFACIRARAAPRAFPLVPDWGSKTSYPDLAQAFAGTSVRTCGDCDPHANRHLFAKMNPVQILAQRPGRNVCQPAAFGPGTRGDIDNFIVLGPQCNPNLLQGKQEGGYLLILHMRNLNSLPGREMERPQSKPADNSREPEEMFTGCDAPCKSQADSRKAGVSLTYDPAASCDALVDADHFRLGRHAVLSSMC